MSGRLKFFIAPLALVLIAVATFMLWPASTSRQEAQEIAITHVGGGTANRPDRDFERFQQIGRAHV